MNTDNENIQQAGNSFFIRNAISINVFVVTLILIILFLIQIGDTDMLLLIVNYYIK